MMRLPRSSAEGLAMTEKKSAAPGILGGFLDKKGR